jgi:hypothetical protein
MEWLNLNPTLRNVDMETLKILPKEVHEWIQQTWTKTGDTYTKPMDQLNQTAFHILNTEGVKSASNHMMEMSGMDYARMRMDYG